MSLVDLHNDVQVSVQPFRINCKTSEIPRSCLQNEDQGHRRFCKSLSALRRWRLAIACKEITLESATFKSNWTKTTVKKVSPCNWRSRSTTSWTIFDELMALVDIQKPAKNGDSKLLRKQSNCQSLTLKSNVKVIGDSAMVWQSRATWGLITNAINDDSRYRWVAKQLQTDNFWKSALLSCRCKNR